MLIGEVIRGAWAVNLERSEIAHASGFVVPLREVRTREQVYERCARLHETLTAFDVLGFAALALNHASANDTEMP
jgi:hypothetical protein